MKKTLLGLVTGILTFSIGVLFFYLSPTPQEVLPVTTFGMKKIVEINDFGPSSSSFRVIQKNETKVDDQFSITGGDYFSLKHNEVSMYLYSATRDERNVVVGYLYIGLKPYDFEEPGRIDPNTGEFVFKTSKIRNIQYVVSGKVTQKKYDDGEIVLQAKLEKIKNQVVIATSFHKFQFYYHVCPG
jgi:hypothetical protein